MTGEAITSPASKLENAFAMIILAIRFAEACDSGHIPDTFGQREVRIDTDGPGLTVAPERYSKAKLVDVSFNVFLMAVGQTAIVADQALDQAFGPKDPSDLSARGSARNIIYAIRNAFAHEPLRPSWRIKGKYARRCEVSLPRVHTVSRGDALNKQRQKGEDFGGWEGYIELLKFCHEEVSQAPNVSNRGDR